MPSTLCTQQVIHCGLSLEKLLSERVGSCRPLERLDEFNDQITLCQEVASDSLAPHKTPRETVPGHSLLDLIWSGFSTQYESTISNLELMSSFT